MGNFLAKLKFCLFFGSTLCYGQMVLAQVDFTGSELPIIVINTNGNQIVDEPKVMANMGIIDNGEGNFNNLTDPFNDYDGHIGIEIRGSSSQLFPKKSYGVETWDADGLDIDASLLDMPLEEDWVLHAPYSDKTLLRNVLTYHLYNEMGRYAPKTRLCELVINGEYQGVYVLMEKIKRDVNRVDISKLKTDDISGDELTGGYIVKIDKTTGSGGDGWLSPFKPNFSGTQEIFFQYEYPKESEIVTQQKNYIEQFITDFETALAGSNFTDPDNGYAKYIDVESFIDFMIINEISKNVDGYRLSTFLYKDKDSENGKLVIGPPWDFNLSFGNADYCNGGESHGFAFDFNLVCDQDFWQVPFWWKKLLSHGGFKSKLSARWEVLRDGPLSENSIHTFLDDNAEKLAAAQKRNFEKWPVLGQYVWPNNFIGGLYEVEVNYVKNWTSTRLQWLDNNISGFITNVNDEIIGGLSYYPNPFLGNITFQFKQNINTPLTLNIFNNIGQVIWTETVSAGTKSLNWNGKGSQGTLAADGLYYFSFSSESQVVYQGKLIKR